MTTVLVTGAGGSAAENVLHSLRMAGLGLTVIGADISAERLHLSTADDRFLLPRASSESYLEAVNSAIDHFGVDVVHAQPDPEVMVLGKRRDHVAANMFLPAQATLELAADKAAFAKRLRTLDIPVPESSEIDSFDHLAEVVHDFRRRHDRLWLRARSGAGSRASLPVRSFEQAQAWVRWWIDERGMSVADFMVSEMLPGREFAYQSVWQHGRLVAGQLRERLEYLYGFLSPSGQSSTPAIARTVDEPDVDELAQRAVRAIDEAPHGVYCVDMKADTLGRARVTEVNAGRFFTTSNFFAQAGLNMPAMAVRAAMGETLTPRGSSPLEADLYWIRMVDMGYALVPGAELHRWATFPRTGS